MRFDILIAAGALVLSLAGAAHAADAAAGKTKAQMCAVCHGLDGIGKNPEVPNLAAESPIYVSTQLKAFKSGARLHPQMTIIAQGLSDEDIADLASWYSSLKITVEMPN